MKIVFCILYRFKLVRFSSFDDTTLNRERDNMILKSI
jgi:hypothetical protein